MPDVNLSPEDLEIIKIYEKSGRYKLKSHELDFCSLNLVFYDCLSDKTDLGVTIEIYPLIRNTDA